MFTIDVLDTRSEMCFPYGITKDLGRFELSFNLFEGLGVFSQKVADENPAKGIEMKSLIRISPAFMAVQPGETALLGEMNKIINAKLADGSLGALRLKWFKDEQKEVK